MGRLIRYGIINLFLIGAIVCAVFLPRRDLRSTAQVAGIALDRVEDQIEATFELYSPSADQPIGAEKMIVCARGDNLDECIKNASRSIGKELYLNDVSALLLGEDEEGLLIRAAMDYYIGFSNDNMDLPILFAKNQAAKPILNCEGKILSTEIAESAKILKKRITVRDCLNGKMNKVWIKGEENYEIIS